MFISFEGTEGVGKTTLIKGLVTYLEQRHKRVVTTREPGGTPFAEQIRNLLLTPNDESIAADCELLLMFAARVQHIEHIIAPALQTGQWVLCDRFVDASFAYQCGGRGVSHEKLDSLVTQFISVMPNITFWLDAPVEVGLARAAKRGSLDRFEQEKVDFFQRVHHEYARRALAEPNRFIRLDATLPAPALLDQAVEVIDNLT